MKCKRSVLLIIPLLFLAATCKHTASSEFVLGAIPFPEDNPMSIEKIELGKQLFFDKRLSSDNSISCASCHLPEKAFTDGKALSIGVNGGITMRNAPSILNAAYLKTIMFDGELKTLEMQVIVPIQEHVEMNENMKELIKELRMIPEYQQAARTIFNRDFDPWVLTRSIAAFERSLISQNSAFDRFWKGDQTALTAEQKRGWKVFSKELYCTKCHPAPAFTTYLVANNGLYLDYGTDNGRFRITNDEKDKGKFKIPSLRNITLTGPYMHDGKMLTIKDVVKHYQMGGKGHVNQSEFIHSFQLTKRKEADLEAFFTTLTDTSYLSSFR